MTVKSSISLSDEQHAFAKALVDAGRFSSVSAVLQQGVDLLRLRINGDAAETAALVELLARRRAGAFLTATQMDRRITDSIAEKRRPHAVQD